MFYLYLVLETKASIPRLTTCERDNFSRIIIGILLTVAVPKDKRQTLKTFKFQGDSTWQLADISENRGGLRHSEGTVGDHLEDENTGEKARRKFSTGEKVLHGRQSFTRAKSFTQKMRRKFYYRQFLER